MNAGRHTHNLQSMNLEDFHFQISQGYNILNQLERGINAISSDLARYGTPTSPFYLGFPSLRDKAERNLAIKQRAYHRLQAWLRKQVTLKYATL